MNLRRVHIKLTYAGIRNSGFQEVGSESRKSALSSIAGWGQLLTSTEECFGAFNPCYLTSALGTEAGVGHLRSVGTGWLSA